MSRQVLKGLVKLSTLLFMLCMTTLLGAASIANGNAHEVVKLGETNLEIFTYRPKKCTVAAVLLVFHGLHRNVESYRDDLHSVANEFCMLEVVPLFDEQRFPAWRYQKGGIAHQGRVMPSEGWTGNFVIALVEWIRKDENRPGLPYVMVGHSAGAQFLSRFAAFTRNEATSIVIANPSTHVIPSLAVDAPFGFRGVYDLGKADGALQNYLAQPVLMVLGEDDVGDKDRDDEPAALEQGRTRFERGMNAFHTAQAVAAAHGWPLQWKLIELPGVGHSAGEVFGSRQVKAVIRRALEKRTENTVSP